MNVPSATNWPVETGVVSGRAEAQEHVFTLLRSVQREFRRQYLELIGDQGLPFPVAGPCLAVLREISEHPGVTLNEVARMTALPKSRVSVLISGLAGQGIVRKDGDSHDSRLVRLHLTPKGSRRTAQWSSAARQAIDALLQPLSDDELEVIAEGLAALQRAFGLTEDARTEDASTEDAISAEQPATRTRPC